MMATSVSRWYCFRKGEVLCANAKLAKLISFSEYFPIKSYLGYHLHIVSNLGQARRAKVKGAILCLLIKRRTVFSKLIGVSMATIYNVANLEHIQLRITKRKNILRNQFLFSPMLEN